MSMPDDAKATLHTALRRLRATLLVKVDGLGEYDARRPMTPTGTNLLGLIKHTGSVQLGYFGEVFDRREDWVVPWLEDDADDDRDMWVPASETRAEILDFFDRSARHSDATIDELPLDAPGIVPWWPEERRNVTLHGILAHVVQEFARHAGHADILRETIDGATWNDNRHPVQDDPGFWSDYTRRIEAEARAAETGAQSAGPHSTLG
ncbi:DinB family protein [Rathayibacter sp. KR2-224]|uniref:DinB family protein n=1 Tax=Rathayibacter sp. KR2-224 TaxID=3400913 RepID=UPI003C0E0E09